MSHTPSKRASTQQLRTSASQQSLTHKTSSGSMRSGTGNVTPRQSLARQPSNGQLTGTNNGVQFDRDGFPIVSAGTSSKSSSPNRGAGAPRPVAYLPGPTGGPQQTISGGGQPASTVAKGTVGAVIAGTTMAALATGYFLKQQHNRVAREGMPENQTVRDLHRMLRGDRPNAPTRRDSSPH